MAKFREVAGVDQYFDGNRKSSTLQRGTFIFSDRCWTTPVAAKWCHMTLIEELKVAGVPLDGVNVADVAWRGWSRCNSLASRSRARVKSFRGEAT